MFRLTSSRWGKSVLHGEGCSHGASPCFMAESGSQGQPAESLHVVPQGLLWETSLLDADEGIRFRGYSIPELQVHTIRRAAPLS